MFEGPYMFTHDFKRAYVRVCAYEDLYLSYLSKFTFKNMHWTCYMLTQGHDGSQRDWPINNSCQDMGVNLNERPVGGHH